MIRHGPALLATTLIAILFLCVTNSLRNPTSSKSVSMTEVDQPPISDKALRLVIVSDTHRSYFNPIPPGDILIHCGDSELSPEQLTAWLDEQGHSRALTVSGNMDFLHNKHDRFPKHVTYLQDSAVQIHGLQFYGSPWTPEFVGAFQLYSDNDALKVWDAIPRNVDVLITHGPPADVLDRTSRGKRVGDHVLADVVRNIRPRVHCFGHIHESYGTLRQNGTLFCNAAVFNGHPPLVIDVPFDRTQPAILITDIESGDG